MRLTPFAQNQNSLDRSIRFFVGVSLAVATAPGMPFLEGVSLRYVLFVFALANIYAALSGWCAGYALFGYSNCRNKTESTTADVQPGEEVDPQALLESSNKLRNSIVAGVVSILLLVAAGYLYQTTVSAKEYERQRILEGLLIELQDLAIHLADDERVIRKSNPHYSDDEILRHVQSENYVEEFGFNLPTIMTITVGGVADNKFKSIEPGDVSKIVKAFNTALLINTKTGTRQGDMADEIKDRENLLFTVDGSTYAGATGPLLGSLGTITLIRQANEGGPEYKQTIERALIITAVFIWIVGWLTFVLTREIQQRLKKSNAMILDAFRRIEANNRDLEKTVAERTRTQTEARLEAEAARSEAESARADAEDANRAKSTFLANMSHEIRTPMNAILGMCHLASKTDLSDNQLGYVTKIQSAATNLMSIINGILDFSKIESGATTLENIDFNLRKVVQDTADLLSQTCRQKKQKLTIEIDPRTPVELNGDPLRLSQVLTNLANNAVKFTPEGGRISVRVEPEAVSAEEVILQFEVQDSGIGISLDQQDNIFKPFIQADQSNTRVFGGTGLGLVITKELVELMGGSIRVDSAPGEGSTFYFSVKMRLAAENPTSYGGVDANNKSTEIAEENCLAGLSILLVEDNDINREIALTILQEHGAEVIIAENGSEALREVSLHKFDCVLMDCQMPVMDGYEATQRLREQAEFRDIPIIAFTANAMKGDEKRILDAGMNDIVSKPFSPVELIAVIRKWTDN